MWSRPHWIIWFSIIGFLTLVVYFITTILSSLLRSRASLSPTIQPYDASLPPTSSGGRRAKPASSNPITKAFKFMSEKRKWVDNRCLSWVEGMLERTGDERVRWGEGIGWVIVGGSLAGGCLVFTKVV